MAAVALVGWLLPSLRRVHWRRDDRADFDGEQLARSRARDSEAQGVARSGPSHRARTRQWRRGGSTCPLFTAPFCLYTQSKFGQRSVVKCCEVRAAEMNR